MYNWVLISYSDEAPKKIGWLSSDCLKDEKTAAKYLCEKYTDCIWVSVPEVPDDPELKNLENKKER